MKIALFGLGLIGGSLALALRARRDTELVAVERGAALAQVPADLVGECIASEELTRVERALAQVDLAVLCTPVRVIERTLGAVLGVGQGEAGGPVVTDCGSTKRALVASVAEHPRRAWYVPGHPMAGAPDGGLANARADLFAGRRWLLCPEGARPDAVARVSELIAAVGAVRVDLGIQDHDRAVALTSHVPQLLASALAVVAERSGARVAAGPSFQSATRVAGGPEAVWFDIFGTNGDEVARALGELRGELERVERALAENPSRLEPVMELLRAARRCRSSDAS
jgi:prephenate dehydrogenase